MHLNQLYTADEYYTITSHDEKYNQLIVPMNMTLIPTCTVLYFHFSAITVNMVNILYNISTKRKRNCKGIYFIFLLAVGMMRITSAVVGAMTTRHRNFKSKFYIFVLLYHHIFSWWILKGAGEQSAEKRSLHCNTLFRRGFQ